MEATGGRPISDQGRIEVRPATADRWPDVATVLGGDEERGCWCQAWRGADEIARRTGESRSETLRRQLLTSFPPPGYLAYLGDQPVGWVGVSARASTPRLAASRTIPAVVDLPVWSIGCFRVRVGYRRRGVATALLGGVIDAARVAGAPGIEAYPIDPGGRRVDVGFAFVGLASMFDRAGFERVAVTNAHSAGLPRILVRRMFGQAAVGDAPGRESDGEERDRGGPALRCPRRDHALPRRRP